MKIIGISKYILSLLLIAIKLVPQVACEEREAPTGEDTVIFTDALGREVQVKKNPARVAALLGGLADVWTLAGGTLSAAAEDAFEDFGLASDGCVNLGGAHSPSMELLISADPDFVIASASTASNVEMRDALEGMGITVAYFDVDHFSDYLTMLSVCTDITGRKDLYTENGLLVKAQIDAVKAQYAVDNVPVGERKILLLRVASSFVKAKGSRGTVLGEMLADLGCINIADSDTSLLENLSVEAVMREQPYHIFVVTMGSDASAAEKMLETMIKENPAWSTLGAVKEQRLHVMEKTLFHLKPNDRWAEAYGILYETLTGR
jgi:iron complex transport system substrate-binding protein